VVEEVEEGAGHEGGMLVAKISRLRFPIKLGSIRFPEPNLTTTFAN
jgi:hypothetical protein